MKTARPQAAHLHIPYLLIACSLLPLFVLAGLVPAEAQGGFYGDLERFIDRHLFGQVGIWSSMFPLTAKVIGNYIALAAPIFSLWVTICSMRRSLLQPVPPAPVSLARYAWIALGCVLLDAFLIYQNYFTFTDFATQSRQYRFFGVNVVFFPVLGTLMLLAIYVMAFLSYNLLFRYPRDTLAQRKRAH